MNIKTNPESLELSDDVILTAIEFLDGAACLSTLVAFTDENGTRIFDLGNSLGRKKGKRKVKCGYRRLHVPTTCSISLW